MNHRTSDRPLAQQERVEDMWAIMSAILVNGRDAQSAESYWYCNQPYQEEGSANDFSFAVVVFEDGTLQVKSSQDELVNQVLINGEHKTDENSILWSCEWTSSSESLVSSFVLLVFRDQSAQVITETWAESLQWSVASACRLVTQIDRYRAL